VLDPVRTLPLVWCGSDEACVTLTGLGPRVERGRILGWDGQFGIMDDQLSKSSSRIATVSSTYRDETGIGALLLKSCVDCGWFHRLSSPFIFFARATVGGTCSLTARVPLVKNARTLVCLTGSVAIMDHLS